MSLPEPPDKVLIEPHRRAAGDSSHAPHVPVNPVPGTARLVVTSAVGAAIILALAFLLVRHARAKQEAELESVTLAAADAPQPVNVVRVESAAPAHVLTLPGEARAWYQTTIYARVSGYLKKWLVDIGDHVTDGQVLASIETPELDDQLHADLAKVEADKAQITLAKASMHFAEVTLARFKDAPKGVVSDLERDQKQADYESSQARLTAAQSDLNSAEADVARLQSMTAFKQVTAPFDGTITERHADIGDLVTAGSTASTTSLFTIAQSEMIRVFVDVPQSSASDIRDGAVAAAFVPGDTSGRTFEGRVARNSRAIDPAAKTLRVEVDVPNPDLALLPGTYLEVTFHTNDQKPPIEVPASALNFRSGGPQVAVVQPDGRVTFRNVTISRDMGGLVEIGSGLSRDDRVVLNISNQIAEGDRVTPVEVSQPPPPAPAAPSQAATTTASAATAVLR